MRSLCNHHSHFLDVSRDYLRWSFLKWQQLFDTYHYLIWLHSCSESFVLLLRRSKYQQFAVYLTANVIMICDINNWICFNDIWRKDKFKAILDISMVLFVSFTKSSIVRYDRKMVIVDIAWSFFDIKRDNIADTKFFQIGSSPVVYQKTWFHRKHIKSLKKERDSRRQMRSLTIVPIILEILEVSTIEWVIAGRLREVIFCTDGALSTLFLKEQRERLK